MHLETYNITQIAELIEASKNVLILPSPKGGIDTFASAAGLYNILSKLGKTIQVIYPQKQPEGAESLIPSEVLKKDASERTLQVSIDYSTIGASKIKYTNDSDVFNLMLGPVNKDFDLKNVSTTLLSYDYDLVITLGLRNFDDLGFVYQDLKSGLESTKIINIDRSRINKSYGFVNIIDETASSISALLFNLLFGLQITPDEKAAKALLVGMTRSNLPIGQKDEVLPEFRPNSSSYRQ